MVELSKRHFSRGNWDLRRDERRKDQKPIHFPERRQSDRRDFSFGSQEANSDSMTKSDSSRPSGNR
jgi:hypothetical protein